MNTLSACNVDKECLPPTAFIVIFCMQYLPVTNRMKWPGVALASVYSRVLNYDSRLYR